MCLRYQGAGNINYLFPLPDLAVLPQVARSEFFIEMSSGGWSVLLQLCIWMWFEIVSTEKKCCKNQMPLDFYPHYPEVCNSFVI